MGPRQPLTSHGHYEDSPREGPESAPKPPFRSEGAGIDLTARSRKTAAPRGRLRQIGTAHSSGIPALRRPSYLPATFRLDAGWIATLCG